MWEQSVITVRGLRHSYGDVEAVRGIDLDVRRGEILAFLGPNGAGKTTTVEILEGYLSRSGGEVSVLDLDPAFAGAQWRNRVGIVLQTNRLQPRLTVRETLEMYAGYYTAPRAVTEVLALVGLESKADERAGRLSGGQQRRLDVGVALIGDPELLFLDEPTTGFDPSARRQAWSVIAGLRELGKTVFLTTHYMDEAQALADRVTIIVDGRIVAAGTPGEIGGPGRALARITFTRPQGVGSGELPESLRAITSERNGALELESADPVNVLHTLTGWAIERGIDLADIAVARPTLEDVYLSLTGAQGAEDGDPQ